MRMGDALPVDTKLVITSNDTTVVDFQAGALTLPAHQNVFTFTVDLKEPGFAGVTVTLAPITPGATDLPYGATFVQAMHVVEPAGVTLSYNRSSIAPYQIVRYRIGLNNPGS